MRFTLWDSNILARVVLLFLFSYYSEAQLNGDEQGKRPDAPTCSLELLQHLHPKTTSLFTVNLTGPSIVGGNIICTPRLDKILNNASEFVKCDEDIVHVDTGYGNPRESQIRINCSDTSPITYDQDWAPPFRGIQVSYQNYIPLDKRVRHEVSTTFPDVLGNGKEGLESYSGVYTFSRKTPEWNFQIRLNFTSNKTEIKEQMTSKKFCIKILEDRMDCEVDHSDADVYFVNVGGNNPTETNLKRACLDASVQNACGNKFPGTNCLQNRYCKKIANLHQNGLARCMVDNTIVDVEYFQDINGHYHTNMSKMWEDNLLIKIEREDHKTELQIEIAGYIDEDEASSENPTEISTSDLTEDSTCMDEPIVAIFESMATPTLYDQDFNKLECHFMAYFFATPVLWFVGWEDGSQSELFTDYGDNITAEKKVFIDGSKTTKFKIKSSHLEFQSLVGMQNISCELWYWNSNKTASQTQNIVVLESYSPEFSSLEESHSHSSGETLELKCEVSSQPEPEITWEFSGQKPQGNITLTHYGSMEKNASISVLTIPKAGPSESGQYICTASNFRGSARKVFSVYVYDNSKTLGIALGATSIFLIALLVVVLARLYKLFLKQRARLSKLEISEFINGNKTAIKENDYAHVQAKHMAYNKEYELSWNQFELEQQELGKGVHGVVYKGKIGDLPIAVKTTREGVEKEVLMALLDELKIMIYLGQHDHVVNLKGACTQFLEEGRVYVIVEFCPFGSLESFLRKHRANFCRDLHIGAYANSCSPAGESSANLNIDNDYDYFNVQHLSNWSYQISKGMKYLEEKKVIHGDLAIRNVLMGNINQVKITDFGLSRQLINTDTYVKKQQALLPWKYMAIEAMREFRFTSKSDVWSYGVTIWEIFTLGSTPYPGMNWTPEFMQLLEDNMRLYKPKHANDEMYKLMLECWAPEPEDRPSFADLEKRLRT